MIFHTIIDDDGKLVITVLDSYNERMDIVYKGNLTLRTPAQASFVIV